MSSSDAILHDNFWSKWLTNRNKLYILCHIWTKGDTAFTEDILSEALLHTCKKYRDHGETIQNFEFWIKAVTFNIFLQIKRRHKRHLEVIELSGYMQQSNDNIHQRDPQSIVFHDHYRSHIYDILRLLPEKLQSATKLFIEGRNYKEISETLGISEANVRKRVQLAKDKIYQLVAEGKI